MQVENHEGKDGPEEIRCKGGRIEDYNGLAVRGEEREVLGVGKGRLG